MLTELLCTVAINTLTVLGKVGDLMVAPQSHEKPAKDTVAKVSSGDVNDSKETKSSEPGPTDKLLDEYCREFPQFYNWFARGFPDRSGLRPLDIDAAFELFWTADTLPQAQPECFSNPASTQVDPQASGTYIAPLEKLTPGLKNKYRHYFPALQFSSEVFDLLANMDEEERTEYEACFSQMNRGTLNCKCSIRGTRPVILEREAGADGRRVYFQAQKGNTVATIVLIGRKNSQIRDLARLRHNYS